MLAYRIYMISRYAKYYKGDRLEFKWDNERCDGKILIGNINSLDEWKRLNFDTSAPIWGIGGRIRW